MTSVDLLFFLLLFFALVLGARRGFYKEVVHALAVLIGLSAAWKLRGAAGGWVASTLGLPQVAAEAVGAIGVWVLVFMIVAVTGRLILKRIRGDTGRLDEGAENVADVLGGDTKKGPVTRLTDPIAGKTGIFYWSDKLFGAALGFAKGAVTGYALLGLTYYAAELQVIAPGWGAAVEDSLAARVYQGTLDPHLQEVPEYQVAKSAREVKKVAEVVAQDPEKAEVLAKHPALGQLREDPRIKALAQDPELRAAVEARDFQAVLSNPKVQAALTDRDLYRAVGEIDWAQVRADVEAGRLPEPVPPPGQGEDGGPDSGEDSGGAGQEPGPGE